ncbi:hypothetical protein F8G81_18400 [Arthrobacter sp. CDRTa11]|uniref:lipoprotein n=1 Tax=Arthrobacter sp. CDRTa11 TaxID=2651199 RepID=UPI002265DBB2|nr:hypothetical protein [Arthrobacter sp. CDRTa11]UZX04362.1 hypothetical protein F8G81_18400 [Arthrobacter sp. CDRTa11]
MKRFIGGFLLLLVLAGCAPDGAGASTAAEEFHQALASGDAEQACSMLSQSARDKAESDGGCESQLEELQLSDAGAPGKSEVYGRNAMVEFENDTVFLAAASSGWQITGAGCTSQGESGYMCEVGGK